MRAWIIVVVIVLNLATVVFANVSFKLSAASPGWHGFLAWQVLGNLAGFASVITLTFLLRYIPLSIAFAFSAGLGFVLVEAVGAQFIFHESISSAQWLGVLLVTIGIILISQGR